MIILFDIGATHVRIARASADGIEGAERFDTPTSPERGIELLVSYAAKAGEAVERAIGGVPAIVGDGGVIVTANNLPEWSGFPFTQMLSEKLEAPVELHNDAELNGLGEAVYGPGKHHTLVAYMGLGTGVGTALIRDGKPVPHMSTEEGGVAIMTLADGSWLEDLIGGRTLFMKYGKTPVVLPPETWKALAPRLAEGVGNALMHWSPELVILGGSLMNEEAGFKLADVLAELPEGAPVVTGTLGDASGLWGARALV